MAVSRKVVSKKVIRVSASKIQIRTAKMKMLLDKEHDLARERAETLAAELGQLTGEAGPTEVEFDEDSGESAGVSVEVDRCRTLHRQAMAELGEIEDALARLAAGTYGKCEVCGRPIPVERLEALPATRRCVACKSGGLLTRRSDLSARRPSSSLGGTGR
ncbi:MAG: TraR/DksA family transcriptional regulator [Acidimicrobiales bacterium]